MVTHSTVNCVCLIWLFTFDTVFGISAFPGAEGGGANVTGGRGGKVVFVTNTNANGPGSFVTACEMEGPRYIIFRTGGLLSLRKTLRVKPNATIAGQTAPGDGFCMRGGTLTLGNNVICRGLRVRPGDDASHAPPGSMRDGIQLNSNTIVDHCSISWAVDENLQIFTNNPERPQENITVQWSFTGEALSHSIHPKGQHSMGFQIGRIGRNISIHHNLFLYNAGRNPNWQGSTQGEIINNVKNNFISVNPHNNTGSSVPINHTGTLLNNNRVNIIGNYSDHECTVRIGGTEAAGGPFQTCVRGNIDQTRQSNEMDETLCVRGNRDVLIDRPACPSTGVTIHDAFIARDLVLKNAGAIHPIRDEVDTRIIEKWTKRRMSNWKGTIDSQNEVGGWPHYAYGTPPRDADNDGMPDVWEVKQGGDLNPVGHDLHDTYDNIEIYINGLYQTIDK